MSTTDQHSFRPHLQWRLRVLMAERGIVTATDLCARLSDVGLKMSSANVSRLVKERPRRLDPEMLEALMLVLGCDLSDLLRKATA